MLNSVRKVAKFISPLVAISAVSLSSTFAINFSEKAMQGRQEILNTISESYKSININRSIDEVEEDLCFYCGKPNVELCYERAIKEPRTAASFGEKIQMLLSCSNEEYRERLSELSETLLEDEEDLDFFSFCIILVILIAAVYEKYNSSSYEAQQFQRHHCMLNGRCYYTG